MKKLTSSFIFNQAMKNPGTRDSIKNINLSRDSVSINEDLYDPINIINRRMKYAGKISVINNINSGNILFLYNPSLGTPKKYLHTMLTGVDGKVKAMVNITGFGRSNDIYPKTLFALAQSGVVSLEMFKNWNAHINNINEIKLGSVIYAQMFGKVLDKLFAIKIDPYRSDLIHYLIAKFYLLNMCDRADTDTISDIAMQSCFNRSSRDLIQSEGDSFPEQSFSDIEKFVKELSKLNMPGLNLKIFLENWARMYDESTILALDYLPAFYSMCFSTSISGNLAKDYIIYSIAGTQIDALYHEFFRNVR